MPHDAAHYAREARRIAEGPSRYVRFARKYPPLVVASFVVIAIVLFVALFADVLAPYHYTTQNLLDRLKPPAFWADPRSTCSAPTSSDAMC